MNPTTVQTDECTGFLSRLWQWDWSACCVVHDMGGSDGQLLDCLQSVLPAAAWPLAALCVALMVQWRPVYNWLQRMGWVKVPYQPYVRPIIRTNHVDEA